MKICYQNRWHPTEPQCVRLAVFRSAHVGTMVDGWEWCAEHAPPPRYREPLSARGEQEGTNDAS